MICVSLSAALVLPQSPIFVGHNIPFSLEEASPQGDSNLMQMMRLITPFVNIAIVAEIPWLPLLFCSAVHTIYSRNKLSNA